MPFWACTHHSADGELSLICVVNGTIFVDSGFVLKMGRKSGRNRTARRGPPSVRLISAAKTPSLNHPQNACTSLPGPFLGKPGQASTRSTPSETIFP